MKIKSIGYCSIRKLNPGPFKLNNKIQTKMEVVDLGDVNVFIGNNGSSKSTILDMVRTVSDPYSLRSLPRENPYSNITPGFHIEFFDSLKLLILFPTPRNLNLFNVNLECTDHSVVYKISVCDINRYSDVDSKLDKIKEFLDLLPVKVRYMPPLFGEYEFSSEFAAYELNHIRHHLSGLFNYKEVESDPNYPFDKNSYNLPFRELDDGRLSIKFSDDNTAWNNLPIDWLPSGWKSYLRTIGWLISCNDKTICLIEEPEQHLNPKLQRVLMNRIIEITEEKQLQVLIATHSASIIDYSYRDKIKLFHTQDNYINEIEQNSKSLLNQLGYKASDLIQTNCIIWVEGPSDKIYLEHWIKAKNPKLERDIHYSIMTYGGLLLSNMSLNPNEKIKINLCKLNANSFVIMDSDKSSQCDQLKKTALEFREYKNVWITSGREIENYINSEHFLDSLKLAHPKLDTTNFQSGQWVDLFNIKNRDILCPSINKVKVAIKYVEKFKPDFSVLDLNKQVHKVCEFIDKANIL